jgi:hypothetical protein
MKQTIRRIISKSSRVGCIGLLSAACVTVALLLSPSSLMAQAATDKATRIALGAVSGAAKSQVMIPLFLTPYPPETPVGSVSATIEYKDKGLTFQRAEKSFLLDGVGGGIDVKVEKDPKDPTKSVIHAEVATKGQPRKSLREGLLLTLVFKIEPDAPTSTTVNLTIDQASASNLDSPPKPVQPIARKNGTIEIVPPEGVPYVGCFFFSH